MTHQVLIIEDDPDIARLVQLHLNDIDCQGHVIGNGNEGIAAFKKDHYDLVVLDLMLPGMDGLAVCREIRKSEGYVPILMLTAKSSELDRVLGLEMGADDYLTKPFSVLELQARIKALFRRTEALTAAKETQPVQAIIDRGDIVIDVTRHQVQVRGEPVELTAREFDLLLHFASNPGSVYSRIQLLDSVWGYNHEGYEHTVNTHINRLRTKIEADPANPKYILTVWGVGYKFAETC
ncbi:response regulator transcription factor [Sedimenticola sp.]|uniref:response regulator transcription factor n=1 Tax=Sedimenticola sp. TaxID=1940285 RepID=UPI00258A6EE6|nr:response regulator transcription factor [Sedimenticola sp.]MCW8903069.1 response regulator transcription factor [Sedimenticola sp.]